LWPSYAFQFLPIASTSHNEFPSPIVGIRISECKIPMNQWLVELKKEGGIGAHNVRQKVISLGIGRDGAMLSQSWFPK